MFGEIISYIIILISWFISCFISIDSDANTEGGSVNRYNNEYKTPGFNGGTERPLKIAIILPCQMFESYIEADEYYIIEDPVYFDRLEFHKLKLVYLRAVMKNYAQWLLGLGKKVIYVDFKDANEVYKELSKLSRDSIISSLHMYDPIDKITDYGKHLILNEHIIIEQSPYFLNTKADLEDYKRRKHGIRYLHDASFYPWMRKRLGILMKNGQPIGGKWSFDKENREPFDPEMLNKPASGMFNPILDDTFSDPVIKEAIEYIERMFPAAPGSSEMIGLYPTTHDGAKKHLAEFIAERLTVFGRYEDGASKDVVFGYHAVISYLLNVGLLTPKYVIDEVMAAWNSMDKKKKLAVLASVEGFIRQVIGWREFCHLIYHFDSETLRTSNHFGANRKLNDNWWKGTTGLAPIDDICKRVHKYAYAHHIERLMYLAAPMMMCGIAPDEMYKWFMSFVAIDAYDWVMVPNIYGMGSYADGGIMMSRPYFSSGRYIEKMSEWKDKETIELWNDLYYNFIGTNVDKLKANYYTAMFVSNYTNKSEEEKKRIGARAQDFIKRNTT